MDSMNLTNTLIESGRHAELDGLLSMVCDSYFEGSQRYPASACRELERIILTQQYGSALFEMVNFLSLARDLNPGGFADVLWAHPVLTANVCRQIFREEGDSVVVPRSDGQFSVTFSRMPFLAALTEFLVTTLGYDYMDTLVDSIQLRPDFARVSNEISRALYSYLQKYLPSLQSQRKFAALVQFLDQRYGDEFTPSAICDRDIFDFWVCFGVDARIQANTVGITEKPTVDAKTYDGVLRDFVNLARAIELGLTKRNMQFSVAVGSYEEGGVNLETLELSQQDWFGDELPSHYLNSLDEEPLSRLKLLGQHEKDQLRPLIEAADTAQRWSRSLLRSYCFGQVQRRLTQALRRKVGDVELLRICDVSHGDGYSEILSRLLKVADKLDTTEKACLYALHSAGEVEVNDVEGGDYAIKIRELHKAYRSINRTGFEPDPEKEPERIEAFREAPQPLAILSRTLNRWLDFNRDLSAEVYQQDAEIFRAQFIRLYVGVDYEKLA